MSSQTASQDLRCPKAVAFEKAPTQNIHQAEFSDVARCNFPGLQDTALDDTAGSTGKKGKGKNRANLLGIFANLVEILFPGHREGTHRRLEGEEMPPIMVHRLGNLYYVSEDGRRRFAAARNEGITFIQAEVWEYVSRWR